MTEVPELCECPYTNWCQEGRQKLQETFRNKYLSYKVEDCVFYQVIKERTKGEAGTVE